LTDAEEPQMRPEELAAVRRMNRGTRINAIEFGAGEQGATMNFLHRLAAENGGQHAYVDVRLLRRVQLRSRQQSTKRLPTRTSQLAGQQSHETLELRRAKLGPFMLNPMLEVHHRRGRGILSAVGYENDSELMTLCCRCHDRITTAHRRLGRQRGQINSRGRTIDPRGYSFTIAEVTDAAHPRYVRRAIRRTLIGLPKEHP
jgi:hypothetical protein